MSAATPTHRFGDRGFIDEHDIVDVALDERERDVAGAADGNAFGDRR
jgi:hypothetical protein